MAILIKKFFTRTKINLLYGGLLPVDINPPQHLWSEPMRRSDGEIFLSVSSNLLRDY